VREDLTRKMRVFAASLMLGACGFRLAGSDPLPTILAHPYLSLKDPYTDFSRVFEHRLKVAGAALQSNSEGASATIEVTRDQVDQRTLAVTGSTPTQPANIPTLYELTYTVTYRVRGPDKELIANRDFGPIGVAARCDWPGVHGLPTPSNEGWPVLAVRLSL